jgi:hypothetical protein
MPILRPDLTEVQEFKAIRPAGPYRASIKNVVAGMSKTGNPKIIVSLEIDVHGEIFKRDAHLAISGKGAFNFEQLLRAAGFGAVADAYKATDGPRPDFDSDNLIGKDVIVVVEEAIYNDRPSDNINGYLPV